MLPHTPDKRATSLNAGFIAGQEIFQRQRLEEMRQTGACPAATSDDQV